jgi:peptidoglycan/LPS O-acetylase OafA/YrhL
MSDRKPFTGSRLTSIDLLRGCAALGVVITHSFPFEATKLGQQAPWFGYLGLVTSRFTLGVPLFFVISGFCIHLRWAKQYAKTGEQKLAFVPFWKRRLHRLYPPYFVMLCISMAMVLAAYLLGRASYYPEPKLRWIGLDFVAHVFMLHGFYHLFDWGAGNSPMWTLAREEYFYLMYFGLLWCRRRWNLTVTVFGVLVLGLIFPPIMLSYVLQRGSYFTNTVNASAIALWIQWVLGMVCVEAYFGLIKLPRWCRSPWLIPVWFLASEFSFSRWREISVVFAGLTFFTLVNFCITAEKNHSFTNRRPFLWLAKVGGFSYSLYLVHYPVIMILRELFGFLAIPSNVWVALLGTVLKIVICFYVARLFFVLVERRFLNTPPAARPAEARFSRDDERGTEHLSEREPAFQTTGQ